MSNRLYVYDENGFVAMSQKPDPLDDRREPVVSALATMPFPGQVIYSKLVPSPLRALMPWAFNK